MFIQTTGPDIQPASPTATTTMKKAQVIRMNEEIKLQEKKPV
jgi:hypothetical protein